MQYNTGGIGAPREADLKEVGRASFGGKGGGCLIGCACVMVYRCILRPREREGEREGGREPAGGQKIVFGNLCCWYCNNIIVCGFF